MKILNLVFCLFVSSQIKAQPFNIVPMPVEIKLAAAKEKFNLNKDTKIYFGLGSGLESYAKYLNEYFEKNFGFRLQVNKERLSSKSSNFIELSFSPIESKEVDSYSLNVKREGILISSHYRKGLFYGIQTLIQLLPIANANKSKNKVEFSINQLSVKDYPRFSYRGMHLDAGRHFMPVDFIKKYIDYLAFYKFNTFHWHLTEDQGWRIEIKKYPRLTEIGGWRNGTIIGAYPGTGNDSIRHGGFYTQDEIKDVVKYASDRFINIIPEIEMPGHSSAAIAAYPQLSCFPDENTQYPKECLWAGPSRGKQVQQTWGVFEDVFCPSEYTFNFLQDVLDEVMALFPSQYIHIGGDECPKEAWKRSTFCQQLMQQKGLKNEHELQSYFIQRIEKYINSKGKKIIGWDEILEGGLAPNATVMSWRGEQGGIEAARQHHEVIMTPESPLYLNHSQTKNEDSVTQGGYNPLEAVYEYNPIPKVLSVDDSKYILGAQGNVWAEYIDNMSKLEYSIFPRMAALSEVLWTPNANKNWKDFKRRIPSIFKRYESWGSSYSKAYFMLDAAVLQTANFDGVLWKVESKLKTPIHIELEGSDSTFIYQKPVYINKQIGAVASSYENKVYTIQDFNFNKATEKKITLTTPPSPQYPGSGAFTLLDGVQNMKGFARSTEFIGFEGKDCEAIIDLGKEQEIYLVTIHSLHQKGSWIWRPSTLKVSSSADAITYTSLGITDDFNQHSKQKGTMSVAFSPIKTRYLKVLINNWGEIPAGEEGAGHPAWLFVDEIEVE